MSSSKRKNPHRRDIPQRVQDEVQELSELEAEVVKLRFGLGCKSSLSVDKIAAPVKITRERIGKIEAKALSKLDKVLPKGNQ